MYAAQGRLGRRTYIQNFNQAYTNIHLPTIQITVRLEENQPGLFISKAKVQGGSVPF